MNKLRGYLFSALRVVVMVVVLGGGAWLLPTPYMLRAPGHADDLTEIVHVQGGRAHPPGHLYMTTVIYEKASLLYCLYALMDPYAQLLPEEQSQVRLRSRAPHPLPHDLSGMNMMEMSKLVASVVALRHMGHTVRIAGSGVKVIGFLENSPAQEKLKPDDVIEWARGLRVRSALDLRKVLQDLPADAVIPLKLIRDRRNVDVEVSLLRRNGRTIIGFVPQDEFEEVQLPVPIHIDTPNVKGASAGLMFTLEIIDQLTPEGITGGHRVAGTGTIDASGQVGPIEGVELKAVAAHRVGARIFLVPRENFKEATPLPGMTVIPVGNLDDALKALRASR